MIKNNKVAIFIHPGFEEIEAITIIDILRRAEIEIDLIALSDSLKVMGSHQIEINTDYSCHNFIDNDYQGIIIPGGPGVNGLFENDFLISTIKKFNETQKMVAAICAAPQLLGKAGITVNKKITGYPGCNRFLDEAILNNKPYSIDENIITGQSAGTAIKFALTIVGYLKDQTISEKVAKALVIN
ncbi:DJ-1 family protein [Mesoplasma syrphidae]|uniref:DJ-1 family protein n=1 Tax=Mesoplasma syrphidae TaxID=225999 RepID=A0A2K9BK54_9MOLU|nr:DJ-1 family glyoxalase III [Mesoplasma syrphidae]AUF83621.1 DJ-1 family protein [Mesoplasma syrphidae]